MDDIPAPIPAGSSRFMDQLRADMRTRGYAYPTERTYLHWIKRYIIFNKRRHPDEMGKPEIEDFLSYLAVGATVSPSRRLPVVLTHEEVKEVLGHMSGIPKLMVELLYGSGLRLQECLNLRVKDIDFSLHTITVRQGKGDKDRTTFLPSSTEDRLQAQIQKALALHQLDMADGHGEVYMPHALERKLQKGYDIRTIQKLLGHANVTTTEIYTHVLNRGAMGVISPVDD